MIERTTDATAINKIANHPAILPWVSESEDALMDLTAPVSDQQNIVLRGDHGAMIFAFLQPGLFEAHTMVLPSGRGKWALAFVQDCLKYMFCRTGAMEIMTRCPKGNFAAKALARAIHGTYLFTNPAGWRKDGKPIAADIYGLSVQDWMRTAPGLDERGHWFHDRLEEEFARHGRTEPSHPDDDVHDRYVGASVEMCLGGQIDKGAILYNRWAVMAGYVPISIVSRKPATLDIGNALIVLSGDDFYAPFVRDVH